MLGGYEKIGDSNFVRVVYNNKIVLVNEDELSVEPLVRTEGSAGESPSTEPVIQEGTDAVEDTSNEKIRYVNISSDFLSLSETPGSSKDSDFKIPNNAKVELLGEEQDVEGITWVKVEYTSEGSEELAVGWVNEGDLSATPPEPTIESEAEGEATVEEIKYVNTQTIPLKFRENPSLSGKILHELPRGTDVKLLGERQDADGYTWVKVEYSSGDSEEPTIGWVAEEYLVETKPAIIKYVNSSEGYVNCRKDAGLKEDNIILEIPHGVAVQVLEENQEADNIKWAKVILEGWVAGEYLSTTESNMIRVVNSPEVGHLNFRENFGIEQDNKILEIPHGTAVRVLEENTQKGEDGYTWVRVSLEGYVAESYLSKDKPETNRVNQNGFSEGIGQSIVGEPIRGKLKYDPPVAYAADGSIIPCGIPGIDTVMVTDAMSYQKLFTNGIPDSMMAKGVSYDTSLFSSQNNQSQFAMIKIGASGYGAKGTKLSLIDCIEKYKAQIEVCEKNKIPYGLYYYSTSISREEAEKEAQRIVDIINELKSDGTIKDYFVLGVSVDREVYDEADRQMVYGGGKYEYGSSKNRIERVKNVTEATAYMLNYILNSGVTDIANVYIAKRCFEEGNAEQLVDMKSLYNQLDDQNKNKVYIWLVSHLISIKNGQDYYTGTLQETLEYLENIGFTVPIIQSVLDIEGFGDLNNANTDFILDRLRREPLVETASSTSPSPAYTSYISDEEPLVENASEKPAVESSEVSENENTSKGAFIKLGEDIDYVMQTIKKYEESETEYGLDYCFTGRTEEEVEEAFNILQDYIDRIRKECNLEYFKLGISIDFKTQSRCFHGR